MCGSVTGQSRRDHLSKLGPSADAEEWPPNDLNFRPVLSMRVAMQANPSTHSNDDRALDELRALRAQLAALTSELRHRKQRAAKRTHPPRAPLTRA